MIKVINYKECKSLDDILLRSQFSYDDVNEKVKAILEDVKQNGDNALKKYAKMFDNADIENIEATEKEIEEAYNRVDEKFKETLKLAYNNIEKFHKKQLRNSFITNEEDGIVMGQIVNPIEKVGVYIPGGTAVYPSTVLMNVIPAKVAGVNEIILVSPPNKEGKISDNILAAAKIAGVNKIFKTGGAQAIAALSYGTESIPKVYKIVGPGNIYVAMAKRLVYGEVSIDMVAGPSEVLIIADETANPIHIASDMLLHIGKGRGRTIRHIDEKQVVLFQKLPVVFRQCGVHRHIHHTFRLGADGMHPHAFYHCQYQGQQDSRHQRKIHCDIAVFHVLPSLPVRCFPPAL